MLALVGGGVGLVRVDEQRRSAEAELAGLEPRVEGLVLYWDDSRVPAGFEVVGEATVEAPWRVVAARRTGRR